MEQVWNVIQASLVFRLLAALSGWIGEQWQTSLLVRGAKCVGRLAARWALTGWRWIQASALYQALMAVCGWFGRQWRASRLVQGFLTLSERSRGSSEHSVFARLWKQIHRVLCAVYGALGLERVFGGSVLRLSAFWCVALVTLAPLLPTMAVAGLEILAALSLILSFARDRQRRLVFAPVNKYVMLYSAVFLTAAFVSVTPVASLKVALLTVLFTLSALLTLNVVRSRRGLVGLVELMVLAGAVVSAYGLYQYVFRTGYQSAAWVDSDMFSTIRFRVVSTFENPNMLGQYLVLLIPLGGACLLGEKNSKKRLLWLACCGLMCLCMLLTFSRGAWLALLCAGLAFFVLLNPRLLILAPFALAALYFVLPDTVIQRFTSIGNLADNSTSYRVSIWLGTLRMLKDYWLGGVGPGVEAFGTVYPSYGYDEIIAPHSHNLLLQILSDAGVCALVLFLLILFWYFRTLCARLSRTKDWTGRLLQIAFLSGTAGFMVQGMTDFSFYNYRVMFLFWVCLGLGMAASRWQELDKEDVA